MSQFEQAIVRTPCERFADGLTSGLLGKADAKIAKEQHKKYIEALKKAGVRVTTLEQDNDHPDSCFVEDPAIVNAKIAVMTSPCDPSRQGEETRILDAIRAVYGEKIEKINPPGTLEGGDICQAENHYLIGLSRRTNDEGARQLAEIIKKHGFSYRFIDIRGQKHILHLKTGLSYLGDNVMLLAPELYDHADLAGYRKIVVAEGERYAANCIRVNDYVLMAEGFPQTIALVEKAGFKVIPVAVSEFEKQDGGLSCLSLRIPTLLP